MPSTGNTSTSEQSITIQSQQVEVDILTEAKLLEVANSNVYRDSTSLEFLQASKSKVNDETLLYLRRLK